MTLPPASPLPGSGPPGPDGDTAELAELAEPTDAELCCAWPDEFAGPPDEGDAWLAGMSAAELEEIYGTDTDEGQEAAAASAGAGFAAGRPLDEMGPGPVLAAFSQNVLESGLGPLSDDELAGVLRASRRLSSWQAAVEFAAISELDARRLRESGRPGWSRVSEHVSSELAAMLTLTGRSADMLLGLSRDLVRLPVVLRALSAGRIDRSRAVVFAQELAALNDVDAAAIAIALCELAGSMTTGQLRTALKSMVLATDPAAVRRRAEKARAETRVEIWSEGSGNAALAGRELPAADAIAADRRIAAIARALKQAGAPGTLDELRAAVFIALLAGRDPQALLGTATGRAMTSGAVPSPVPGSAMAGSVNLTMPLSAWLGQTDRPGEAAGLGPLDAGTCRELAARLRSWPGTRWCVTLTGADGRALAHTCSRSGPGPPGNHAAWLAGLKFAWLERGTCTHRRQVRGYRPGSLLRTLVKVRHRTCCFPGCRRPAQACDDDHTTPFDQGGLTCECNLAPLCRRHHQAKQAPGWTLTQPEPGLLVWTAPHGRSYPVRPDPYPL